MKEYLLALFAVCMVAGIVKVIASDCALAEHVGFICAICVILCVASPLIKLLDAGFDLEDIFEGTDGSRAEYGEIFDAYLQEQDEKNAEISLARMLEAELSLNEESTSVDITVSNDGEATRVEGVRVILHADAISADPERIKEYIMQYTSAKCDIVYIFT